MECIVCTELSFQIERFIDPQQFAYRPNLSIVDASLTLLNKVHNHLDKSNMFFRILFMDFSSAFNTVQPNIFLKRLRNLGVSGWLILWIKDFF